MFKIFFFIFTTMALGLNPANAMEKRKLESSPEESQSRKKFKFSNTFLTKENLPYCGKAECLVSLNPCDDCRGKRGEIFGEEVRTNLVDVAVQTESEIEREAIINATIASYKTNEKCQRKFSGKCFKNEDNKIFSCAVFLGHVDVVDALLKKSAWSIGRMLEPCDGSQSILELAGSSEMASYLLGSPIRDSIVSSINDPANLFNSLIDDDNEELLKVYVNSPENFALVFQPGNGFNAVDYALSEELNNSFNALMASPYAKQIVYEPNIYDPALLSLLEGEEKAAKLFSYFPELIYQLNPLMRLPAPDTGIDQDFPDFASIDRYFSPFKLSLAFGLLDDELFRLVANQKNFLWGEQELSFVKAILNNKRVHDKEKAIHFIVELEKYKLELSQQTQPVVKKPLSKAVSGVKQKAHPLIAIIDSVIPYIQEYAEGYDAKNLYVNEIKQQLLSELSDEDHARKIIEGLHQEFPTKKKWQKLNSGTRLFSSSVEEFIAHLAVLEAENHGFQELN